jgi:ADP-ribose pyrophosphatase
MGLKKWKKLRSEIKVSHKYWEYHLDKFEIEGGKKGEDHLVHTLGSTMVVPFTSDNKLLLVNQFRYLNQKECLEFPCGSVEAGLSLEENAIKELREEIGKSGNLEYVGEFSPYNGVADEMCSVYIARNLIQSPLPHDETEEIEIRELSIEHFENLIKNNTIWDGMTLAAWVLTKNHLSL